MTFTKPLNVTLTEMAQWVDANSYSSDKDNNKLVEYLYHLIYSRVQRLSYFNTLEQYDDFSLYCVSKLLIRFDNKQEQPVKSVVNYIKVAIEPWRADYVREFCCGSAEVSIADFNVCDFSDYLIDEVSEYDYSSYNFFSSNITDIIRNHLARIPKKKNSAEWSNIYTSCLLTFYDRIKSASALCGKQLATENPQLINRIIRGLKTKPPILYHLDESMSTYISVLVNECTHAVAAELTRTVYSKVSVSDCMKNLVKAAYNEEEDD